MSLPRRWALALFAGIALPALALDLWSKAAVFQWLGGRVAPDPRYGFRVDFVEGARQVFLIIPHHLDFQLSLNTGAAFSVLEGHPKLLAAFSLLAIGLLIFLVARPARAHLGTTLAFGAIAGGAAGNLWDRAYLGCVRDFIHAWWGSYHWPTFNVADSCIFCGIAGLVLMELCRGGRKEPEPVVSQGGDTIRNPLDNTAIQPPGREGFRSCPPDREV